MFGPEGHDWAVECDPHRSDASIVIEDFDFKMNAGDQICGLTNDEAVTIRRAINARFHETRLARARGEQIVDSELAIVCKALRILDSRPELRASST